MSEIKTQDSVPEVKNDDAVATETAAEKPAKDDGAEVTTDHVVEKGASEANSANDDKAKDGKIDEAKPSGDMLKTKARIDHKNRSSNRKFDPSVLPETDDPDKIRNQVLSSGHATSYQANPMFRLSSTLEIAISPLISTCGT